MKLWHKVYLITLAVSLILTNVGIFLVFHTTYQQNLEQEKTRAEAHSLLIYTSINNNMVYYEQRGVLDQPFVRIIGRNHGVYYNNQGVKIQIWQGEDCIYSTDAKIKWEDLQYDEAARTTTLFDKDGEKYVFVTQRFDTKEEYVFCYQQPLTELQQSWDRLVVIYISMSVVISLLLAIFLGVLLQRLMKPIAVLTDAVIEMQQGNYESRVALKGNDDIARLAANFNAMAETICENVKEIRQENEAKQRFVDNFSHELKSPLTSIYGFAEYLQKSNASKDEQVECLGYIMEESERLKKMSYVLLEMEKLHTDGNNIEMEECDCNSIRETVQQEIRMDLERTGVELEWQMSSRKVCGNRMLLEVLLTNLVRNALRACADGGTVRISMEENSIRVQDNGCGMAPENVKRATEPFYRVDKARSRKDGGTGLGLALCRQIAEVHGGRLLITSRVGEGTTVTFSKELGKDNKLYKEDSV